MPHASQTSELVLRHISLLLVLLFLELGWGARPASGQAVAKSGGSNQASTDPARQLQALARVLELDKYSRNDGRAARMMRAYYRGKPTAVSVDGEEIPYAASIGLATCDWTQQTVEGPYTASPRNDDEPFISVDDTQQGKLVGCSPIEIAKGLWCTVDLKVINPEHETAWELDYLIGSVSFFGGKNLANATDEPALLRGQTVVDLWSEKNSDRLTLGSWTREGEARTAIVYGPLLYRVLSSEPEFILIGDRKISLPERFRKACTAVCRRVDEVRLANGQSSPPVFRDVGATR